MYFIQYVLFNVCKFALVGIHNFGLPSTILWTIESIVEVRAEKTLRDCHCEPSKLDSSGREGDLLYPYTDYQCMHLILW
jgi:hypothetical protein